MLPSFIPPRQVRIGDAAAFAGTAPAGDEPASDIAGVLERFEQTLVAQEAELRRRRAAVQRMRERGSRAGLLCEFVTDRFAGLPEGALRQEDLDALLVTERIFGPLGAAERHALESRLHSVIEESGLGQEDEALFDAWDAMHPADDGTDARSGGISAAAAVRMMPYDLSPARLRCMELAEGMAGHGPSAL